MAWMLAAMVAGNFLGAAASYKADKAQAKAQQQMQAWRNAMTMISNAQNQNAITENQIMSDEASRREMVNIQTDRIISEGALTAEAGAAETAGRSVNQALFALKHSADVAEGIRQQNLLDSWSSFDQQRRQSSLDAAMQQDHSYIPKPSLGTYLLGATMKSVGQYQSIKGGR